MMSTLQTITDLATVKQTTIAVFTVGLVDNLVSDHTLVLFQWANFAVLSQFISAFGIITNIINMICFVKLGFKDPVNISLLGLAVSDFGCLVTLTWTNICYNPAISKLDLPFDPIEVQYLTGSWPHATFARVTSWITAFITLERCLCITMPLKVKTLITPTRVTLIIVCIFIILLVSVSPLYYVNRLGMKFSAARNKTILGLIFAVDPLQIERISLTINNGLIPVTAFLTVIVCTIILVSSLRIKIKWRKTSTAPGKANSTSNRDQKVAKMIACISTLFICCFLPICILIVSIVVVPELSFEGRYKNTLIAVGSVGFTLEAANSASNIFIYYYMSSKYREAFGHLMACLKS